jgi:DNA modification methylase
VAELRRAPHPRNQLNELSGEEWLYFTKSVWTTAYPSELGHARRRAHGANKPPRLMARLIEFFTKPGELVLDPFAGVGGTLLGAAIARGPRRALGFELAPRWAEVYAEVVAEATAAAARGAALADLGPQDPGGPRTFDATGCELRVGDARALIAELPDGSVDFVATDPPYNVQLPMTMSGGPLAASFANRCGPAGTWRSSFATPTRTGAISSPAPISPPAA